jgi:uncharacterized protein
MDIAFDPDKDAINRAKHGISLAEAARIDWDSLRYEIDERHDYGETRYRGYGLIDGRLYAVVFTFRDGAMRVINLRKANNREQRTYAGHD